MVLPGETILTGASDYCTVCEIKMEFQVLHSPAGYYIGTQCNCGPYSRESEYYPSWDLAEMALENGTFGRTNSWFGNEKSN